MSGGQKVINREEGAGKGVVVRNSTTYRFSEDDDEAGPESRRPAHEHRLHTRECGRVEAMVCLLTAQLYK